LKDSKISLSLLYCLKLLHLKSLEKFCGGVIPTGFCLFQTNCHDVPCPMQAFHQLPASRNSAASLKTHLPPRIREFLQKYYIFHWLYLPHPRVAIITFTCLYPYTAHRRTAHFCFLAAGYFELLVRPAFPRSTPLFWISPRAESCHRSSEELYQFVDHLETY